MSSESELNELGLLAFSFVFSFFFFFFFLFLSPPLMHHLTLISMIAKSYEDHMRSFEDALDARSPKRVWWSFFFFGLWRWHCLTAVFSFCTGATQYAI